MRGVVRFLVLLAILAAAGFGVTLALPDVVRVERNTVIKAAPEAVFARLGEFGAQKTWFPLAGADPAVTATVTGAAGPGQTLSWSGGDPSLSPGSARVTAVEAPARFVSTLSLPGFAEGTATISVAPSGQGTSVTTAVSLPVDGLVRRWPAYFTFEQRIGAVLVQGLDRLRRSFEAG